MKTKRVALGATPLASTSVWAQRPSGRGCPHRDSAFAPRSSQSLASYKGRPIAAPDRPGARDKFHGALRRIHPCVAATSPT
jgi:hypothetical protein